MTNKLDKTYEALLESHKTAVGKTFERWRKKKGSRRKNPRNIVIIGRRWFAKTYGNTYHSAEIIIDGVRVHRIDFSYGYGDQYLYNAFGWLSANGFIRGYDPGKSVPWRWSQDHEVKLDYSVSDVGRKKDL